jgi:hypothetical protein
MYSLSCWAGRAVTLSTEYNVEVRYKGTLFAVTKLPARPAQLKAKYNVELLNLASFPDEYGDQPTKQYRLYDLEQTTEYREQFDAE